jgi:hypothetical protein
MSRLMSQWPKPRRAFDAVMSKELGGECLTPQTMEGFSSEHLMAMHQGA